MSLMYMNVNVKEIIVSKKKQENISCSNAGRFPMYINCKKIVLKTLKKKESMTCSNTWRGQYL